MSEQSEPLGPKRWLAVVATVSVGLGIAGCGVNLADGRYTMPVPLLVLALLYGIALPPLLRACSGRLTARAWWHVSAALVIPLAAFFAGNAWVALLTRVHGASIATHLDAREWNDHANLSNEVYLDPETRLSVYRVSLWSARIGVWDNIWMPDRPELGLIVDLEPRGERWVVVHADRVGDKDGVDRVWPDQ